MQDLVKFVFLAEETVQEETLDRWWEVEGRHVKGFGRQLHRLDVALVAVCSLAIFFDMMARNQLEEVEIHK